MIRFVPIEKPGGQRDQARVALAAARAMVVDALGPGATVGPVVMGGFEVQTEDPDAESKIADAVAKTAMVDELSGALVMTQSGRIVPDQPSVDGSMLGL